MCDRNAFESAFQKTGTWVPLKNPEIVQIQLPIEHYNYIDAMQKCDVPSLASKLVMNEVASAIHMVIDTIEFDADFGELDEKACDNAHVKIKLLFSKLAAEYPNMQITIGGSYPAFLLASALNSRFAIKPNDIDVYVSDPSRPIPETGLTIESVTMTNSKFDDLPIEIVKAQHTSRTLLRNNDINATAVVASSSDMFIITKSFLEFLNSGRLCALRECKMSGRTWIRMAHKALSNKLLIMEYDKPELGLPEEYSRNILSFDSLVGERISKSQREKLININRSPLSPFRRTDDEGNVTILVASTACKLYTKKTKVKGQKRKRKKKTRRLCKLDDCERLSAIKCATGLCKMHCIMQEKACEHHKSTK